MKIFISADMEGISGIVDPSYIDPDKGSNYARGRTFMTQDLNAVIESALEWGATEIIVADSHHTMNNVLWEMLHPKAKLLAGSPRDFSMMQGLDATFDTAFFIGYHARHGMPGVLSHTMTGVVKNMYINGEVVGEFGFNAIYAALTGVPVCLVSGDDQIAMEAKHLIPEIETAIVKYAVSRTSALCLSLEESHLELKEKTKLALEFAKKAKPFSVSLPLQLRMEFTHSGQAEMAAIVPGTTLEPGTTAVCFSAKDQYELYRVMRAMLNLAGTVEFC